MTRLDIPTTDDSWDNSKWNQFYDQYKDFHKSPELSGEESETATKVENALKSFGLGDSMTIYRNIGRTVDDNGVSTVGESIFAVIWNSGKPGETGKNSVVLLRADMDALPVQEATGLKYKSEKENKMPACGHDLHMSALLAAVKAMAENRTEWKGTLIACFQSSEKNRSGALAMIKDNLYKYKHDQDFPIPVPNFVFGGHVTPEKTGTISLTRGVAYARSESYTVTFKGKSGHGSRLEAAVDPIVMAAYAVTRLQTVVPRVVPSMEAGVLTVGQINARTASNIIPSHATIVLNTRADSNELAERMGDHIRQIVMSETQAALVGRPDIDDKGPNPDIIHSTPLPLLKNEEGISNDIANVFTAVFEGGFKDNVPGVSESEDFANLACEAYKPNKDGVQKPTIPYCYWRYGSTDSRRWKNAGGDINKVPSNHNSYFYPQLDVSDADDPLEVGAKAYYAAALSKLLSV